MTGLITPILLVALSVGAFMWYIDPTYTEVRALQVDVAKHDEALGKANELRELHGALEDKRNGIDDAQVDRLLKLLPNNLDSVRLVLDLDAIAIKYGMRLANLTIQERPDDVLPVGEIGAADSRSYNAINIGFIVKGSYGNIRSFIRALEASLRLVDVESISFGAEADGVYNFKIHLKTYWLKYLN